MELILRASRWGERIPSSYKELGLGDSGSSMRNYKRVSLFKKRVDAVKYHYERVGLHVFIQLAKLTSSLGRTSILVQKQAYSI